MRIDAHQHFWKYNKNDYDWMSDRQTRLMHDHEPRDLKPLLEELSFHGTIAVQARRMAVENDYLLDLSDQYSWIHGVVGWVDFKSSDAAARLEQYAAHPKFRGVRELIHDMPDHDYAVDPAHAAGVGMLEPLGLAYDLLLKPWNLPAAIRLVDRFPRQRFVVDHMAKPQIAESLMEPWAAGIKSLSQRPNVWCKLSGMVTEADWNTWTPGQLQPYIDLCLESFGPARLMIGSDWPVCTCAGDYKTVMSVIIDYVKKLSPSEEQAILGDTCAAFYRTSST